VPGVGCIEDAFEQFHRNLPSTKGIVVLVTLDGDGAVAAVVSTGGFVEPQCSRLLAGSAVAVTINNTLQIRITHSGTIYVVINHTPETTRMATYFPTGLTPIILPLI